MSTAAAAQRHSAQRTVQALAKKRPSDVNDACWNKSPVTAAYTHTHTDAHTHTNTHKHTRARVNRRRRTPRPAPFPPKGAHAVSSTTVSDHKHRTINHHVRISTTNLKRTRPSSCPPPASRPRGSSRCRSPAASRARRERTCRRGLASLNGTTHSHAGASTVMDTGMGSDDLT